MQDNMAKELLENSEMPKLKDIDKIIMDNIISDQECFSALKLFKNGKSPGSDGFTAEFDKVFWSDIHEMVVNNLNYGFENKNYPLINVEASFH